MAIKGLLQDPAFPRHSDIFDRAPVPDCGSTRTRSGRRSEALNTAGSLLTENQVPLCAMV
jgi:hypothetical protein